MIPEGVVSLKTPPVSLRPALWIGLALMAVGFGVGAYGGVAVAESSPNYCSPGLVDGPWPTVAVYLAMGVTFFAIGLILAIIGARWRPISPTSVFP